MNTPRRADAADRPGPAAGAPPSARAEGASRAVRHAAARWLAGAAAIAALAFSSHWLMVHAPDRAWTVAALFGPLLAALAVAGWKKRHAPTLGFCAAAAALLAIVVARGGVADVSRLYVLQHGAIHLVLAWSFAMTLRGGATPLITMLAGRVHATPITPAMQAYTRRLTAVWAGYFVAMIAASLLIYALLPWPVWSFFCNLFTPASAGALFVGEYLWRYRRHPEFERASIAAAVRAYRATGTP
jgi:uncharacterized membrane protein